MAEFLSQELESPQVGEAPERPKRAGPLGASPAYVTWGLFAVAIVVLVVLVAFLARSFFGRDSDSTAIGGQLTHPVTRGGLVISFTERGNVRAASSEKIFCLLEGRSNIVHVVPEGTFVNEGDLLVELDSSTLAQQLNEQQIKVDTAKADLEQARQESKIQESLNQSAIRDAELQVQLAKIDIEYYLSEVYRLDLNSAEQDIKIAQEELARAENKYEWTQKLAEKGYINRMELQADKLSVEKAKVQFEQKKGEKQLLENYTKVKQLKTYQNALAQAEDALDRENRKAAAALVQSQAEERAKESTYNLSVKRLEKLEDQLQKTKILAPKSGMVVYESGGHRGRERIIEQGAEVFENQLLMRLPNVSSMAVEVQVQESWVDQVAEGQRALIDVEALQNLKLSGRVTKVALLPDYVNRWLNPDLKVYETEIVIDEDEDTSQLRPGMSAKVQILITKLEDVLFVPVQSVTTIDKEQVCYVWDGGAYRSRPVTCGRFNDSFIEVTSGLEEGDIVQLNAPPATGGGSFEEVDEFDPSELAEGDLGGEGGPEAGAGGPGGRPVPANWQPGAEAGRSRGGGEGGDGPRRPGAGRRGSEFGGRRAAGGAPGGTPVPGGAGRRARGGGETAGDNPPAPRREGAGRGQTAGEAPKTDGEKASPGRRPPGGTRAGRSAPGARSPGAGRGSEAAAP